MDFNRLYSFIKVAERGSITKAAGDLFLTQQAVSKQMLLLEEELNLTLFNRSNNAVVLTRDGETLLRNVSPLFDNIQEPISQLRGQMESVEGVIKIGTSFDSTKEKLLHIISLFKKKHPNVRFELTFDIDFTLEEMMLSNALDMGILFAFRDKKILGGEPLETKKYGLYCRKDFRRKHGPFKHYKDLLGVPFVEYTQNFAAFGAWMKKNCPKESKAFLQQRPEIVVENDKAIEEFIGSGWCMGFIEESRHLSQKKTKQLVKLFPQSEDISSTLDFVTKRKDNKRFIESEFKKHLFESWSVNSGTENDTESSLFTTET